MPWHIATAQLVEVHNLHDPTSGLAVTLANVRAVMRDGAGVPVSGQGWPTPLQFVDGSQGDYRGLLEHTRVLEDGKLYAVKITATVGGTLVKTWRLSDVARYRGAEE